MSQRVVSAILSSLMPAHGAHPSIRVRTYLQLVSSYIDNSRPVRVLGQISGAEHLDSAQPSPQYASARVQYENGLHVSVAFGTAIAPTASDDPVVFFHKRVFVVGMKGFVHWRFSSWERSTPENGYEGGPLSYGEQDVAAQGNLTEAVFRLAGR